MYQRPESLSWKKRPETPYRAPVLICPTHTQRHRRCEVALHMCDFGVISNDADHFKRFYSYFFCARTHLSHGTRIASLWLRCFTCVTPNQLGPFPLHRFGVAHQTSLRSRSTMMSYANSP